MGSNNLGKVHSIKIDEMYHRGQQIIYKGEEAKVLGVNPVFVIKVIGKNKVVCGNILNEVSPIQGDKSKEDIKVSEVILKDTTNCRNRFACLSGETEYMCEVIKATSSYNAVVIKPKSIDSCKNLLHLDDAIYCLCPTRNEIYRCYNL